MTQASRACLPIGFAKRTGEVCTRKARLMNTSGDGIKVICIDSRMWKANFSGGKKEDCFETMCLYKPIGMEARTPQQ